MKPKSKIKQSDVNAIEACKRRLRLCHTKGNYKEAVEVHNELGHLYRSLEQYDNALEEHKNEKNVYQMHIKNDKIGLAIACRNIGEVYIDMNKEDKAVPFIHQYVQLAKEQEDYVELQRAYITLGRTFLCKADMDEKDDNKRHEYLLKGEMNFKRAYGLLDNGSVGKQLNNEKELINMKCNNCQNLGVTSEMQGNLAMAVKWLVMAVEMAKESSLHQYLLPCNSALCAIYIKQENYEAALKAAEAALKSAKAIGKLSNEVETKLLLAKALFACIEVDAGKKVLKKLRRKIAKKDSVSLYLEELDSLLIPAIKLSRRLDSLATMSKKGNNGSELMQLHEEIADNYSALNSFGLAIQHYLESIKYAETEKIRGKKLSQLYYSIAASYYDINDFENAFKYYQLEMEIHTDPVEKFKTQTHITQVMEKLSKGEDEVISAHKLTKELAVKTNSRQKEATAIQNLALYYRSINHILAEDEFGRHEEFKKKYKLTDLDEPASDSQDDILDSDEVDLDNLSSDSESEEEDNSVTINGTSSRKPKLYKRKNEAGETQLHIAAKHGDLKGVRRYINMGYGVNERDTAGWTPLHEAANFGFDKVVQELINNGAKVNDRGGPMCDGITPLHDALSNGHFAVADILLEHGANVLARDDKRSYPIDHLLIWRNVVSSEELNDVFEDYERIRQLLIHKMSEGGKVYTTVDEKRAAKRKARSRSPQFSLLKSSQMETVPIPVRIANDDFDPDNIEEATEMYRSTIKGLRRHSDRTDRTKNKRDTDERPISPGPRTALIPSELDVHGRWMVNDNQVDLVDFETDGDQSKRKKVSKKRKRATATVLTLTDSELSSTESVVVSDKDSDIMIDNISLVNKKRKQRNSSISERNSSVSEELMVENIPLVNTKNIQRSSISDVLRLKVKVRDHILLVPVDSENSRRTVQWLCDECSSRYQKTYGVKPILSLSTKDGAHLSPSDPINLVIDGNDVELVATVISYDLPSLTQRFQNACKELKIYPYAGINAAINSCQSSNILDLSGLNLHGKLAQAVFMSLQEDQTLTHLILDYCSLFDEDMKEFGKVIGTLTSLSILNLSSNGITSLGFKQLVDGILKHRNGSRSTDGPFNITDVKLTHNPLGNSAAASLADMINFLPKLSSICIVGCKITSQMCVPNHLERLKLVTEFRSAWE